MPQGHDVLHDVPEPSGSRRRRLWWVVLWAGLLSCIYLPTLRTRFDFIDDGNLVYPAAPMPLSQRLGVVWHKIVANYQHLGPFRPVLWMHWEAAAEALHGSSFRWRCVRLLWTALAAGMFLWLLRELGIRPWAAVLTVALAIWNPFRGEVWTSLTLAEGVAMPYALFGLVCAVRAARSSRPTRWDLAGALAILAALGCKNTFAALVPVQIYLRLAPDRLPLREGWRRHGWRAIGLAVTLVLPVAHYVYFKLHWHEGQYATVAPSTQQLLGMLSAVKGALSLDFMAAGLLLTVLALAVQGCLRGLWKQYQAVLLAGLLLLLCGIGIYLPMSGIAGRYSMPAVWGADLGLAACVSALAGVRAAPWRRLAFAALLAGLATVAVSNVGKQEKFAGRAALLWQALAYVEANAFPHGCLGWVESAALHVEEGIHFRWHLGARGRGDVALCLLDQQGNRLQRVEIPQPTPAPTLLLAGTPRAPLPGDWRLVKEFSAPYWNGARQYRCYLFGAIGLSPGE